VLQLSAEALADRVALAPVLELVVDRFIPGRKGVLPYSREQTDARVLVEAPWWPLREVPYSSPGSLTAAQQAQLLKAVALAHRRELPSFLKQLSCSHRPRYTAADWLLIQRAVADIVRPGGQWYLFCDALASC
jgi:hypothetical protein